MADGTITIDTEINTEKLKNKLDKINIDIEKQKNKVTDLEKEYNRLNDTLTDARIRGAYINPDDVVATEKAKINLDSAKNTLENMAIRAQETSDRLREMENASDKADENLKSSAGALDKFTKKLVTMAKKVFVFTVIAKALRGVKSYFNLALSSNEEFQASLAKLRGSIRVAFQPILDAAIPILQALINIVNRTMRVIAQFNALLFGTSVEASTKAAKALNEQAGAAEAAGDAAEKAKRQMSGLDEMNTWESDKKSSGGAASGGQKVDFESDIKDEVSAIEVYLSGALLALGAILTFTGAAIPLGIALMAAGAVGLASALAVNWKTMPTKVKKALTEVLGLLGGSLLIIGAVLAFSGAGLALGIGLMLAGAASLGTAAALNWSKVSNYVKSVWDKIAGFFKQSSVKLALGVILALSGVGLPLGIALIAKNSNGFATPAKLDWSAVKTKLQSSWDSIKKWFKNSVQPKLTLSFWQGKFNNIKEALAGKIKGAINAAISLFNRFVSWVNEKMNISWNGIKVAGRQIIKPGSVQLVNLKQIPMLAQGAVIPANHAFLSVLGDQKQGTNIEAPESLLRKIVREEGGAGNVTFVAQLNGRTIFEETINQAKLRQKNTGKNPFKMGAL